MNMTATALTYPEHQLGVNQDAVIAKRALTVDNKDAFFVVLCDGIGAHGQEAAASVAKAFELWFDAFTGTENASFEPGAIYKSWDQIVAKITRRINSAFEDDGSFATMAVFLAVDGVWRMANVGDVRVYEITNEGAKQISVDHTFAQREIMLGHMSPMEAYSDPQAFNVLQGIGCTKDVILSKEEGEPKEDDTIYLLCTDGFYRRYPTSRIFHNLKPEAVAVGEEFAALDAAKDSILEAGETDDLSAVAIRLFKEQAEEATEEVEEGGVE